MCLKHGGVVEIWLDRVMFMEHNVSLNLMETQAHLWGQGQKSGGSMSDDVPQAGLLPMVDARFLHHWARSPAARTRDTASGPDVWVGLDDGK